MTISLFLQQKAQVTETFEAIFSRCIESIVDGTKRYVSYLPWLLIPLMMLLRILKDFNEASCSFFLSSVGCRLVFVPSQRDVHHHFIYPQPPFTLPTLSKDRAQVRHTKTWFWDSICKLKKLLVFNCLRVRTCKRLVSSHSTHHTSWSVSCNVASSYYAVCHPGPWPLHPADRRCDLRLDVHWHPVPHERRGDQQVRKTVCNL